MDQLSKSQLYQIKPLKWTRKFDEWQQAHESDSAHGSYRVTRHRGDCEEHGSDCPDLSHGDRQSWRWEYCFAEYYNEGSAECTSAAEGKRKAEEHWREYLTAGLVEVRP